MNIQKNLYTYYFWIKLWNLWSIRSNQSFFCKYNKLNCLNKTITISPTIIKTNFKLFLPTQKKVVTKINLSKHKTLKLFKLFIDVNIRSLKHTYRVHPSAKTYFLGSVNNNTSVYSISRLYAKWQDFYYLLFNIYFYKLPILTLGSRLFKDELLSLNWVTKEAIRSHWSLVSPYIFLKRNKINNYNSTIFALLQMQGINLSLVLDTNYHQNTIFYLKRYAFFSIGVVPVTSNLYKVDVALPSTAESTYAHLFFIRLVVHIQKEIILNNFKLYKNLWEF